MNSMYIVSSSSYLSLGQTISRPRGINPEAYAYNFKVHSYMEAWQEKRRGGQLKPTLDNPGDTQAVTDTETGSPTPYQQPIILSAVVLAT